MDDERYTTNFSLTALQISRRALRKKERGRRLALLNSRSLYSSILAKISESLNKKYSYNTTTQKKTQSKKNDNNKKKKTNTHLLAHLDRVPPPAREQNPIPRLDGRRHNASLLIWCAGPDRDHGRFRERVGRSRGREEDTRSRFLSRQHSSSSLVVGERGGSDDG